MKRAIEEGFPIVEINRLAVPERNSFKPIYQMHKWFARRASCVFRAILLGCLKPAGTDIMAEFYKDHTNDPDTNGILIPDPFMGGGTTVVEALRLGCEVIGIDVNPVAWFIVKTEVDPVDLDELRAAFDRLASRTVPWSGESVQKTLLEEYKTICPCCGSANADIVYTFWVKSAVCTNPAPPCERRTLIPLFSDYIISQKTPSIRYWRDAQCPLCKKTFDWEVEPATIIAESALMVSSPAYSAGLGRTTARWAFSSGNSVSCPWCKQEVTAIPSKSKLERKKVPLTALLCPFCEAVWQWRGDLPDDVDCPACHRSHKTRDGNTLEKGKFLCPVCGTKDAVIQSIRQLPEDQLLPVHPYAVQGRCGRCSGDADEGDGEEDLLGHRRRTTRGALPDHACYLTKTNGKFFIRIRPADITRYQAACERWHKEKERLPYPKSEVPWGEKTKSGLIAHRYHYWHQIFNPRQLLCLSTLLEGIKQEKDQILKEMLLSAFHATLNNNNIFARYQVFSYREGKVQGIFSRHDFQPKATFGECNVWGLADGHGSFATCFRRVVEGKSFAKQPFDWQGKVKRFSDPLTGTAELMCRSSTDGSFDQSIAFVVTDPPYGGNVNYAELSDFFYVWLRLALLDKYAWFAPEHTPKAEEIVENPTRGKTEEDFEVGIRSVFSNCLTACPDDGLMVFTFHHSEGSAWESLLRALLGAGYEIHSVYPVHGEAETSLHLMDKQAIAYDLIHVCRKRPPDATLERRSWAGIRQEIRRRAREEIQSIEGGRYGKGLSPADVNIILIGKCLEQYSRHYGAVVDHEDKPFQLREALKEIRNLVDQLITQEQPLPAELEDIEPESRIYLLTLCDRKEIKSDEVHKVTRGILEPKDLMEAGLIIRGRAGRGRTYEVKQPAERFQALLAKFRHEPEPQRDLFGEGHLEVRERPLFVDYLHFLMALAEGGENLMPWLDRFRGETPRLRAACDFLAVRNKAFAPTLKKIRDLIEGVPLFPGVK